VVDKALLNYLSLDVFFHVTSHSESFLMNLGTRISRLVCVVVYFNPFMKIESDAIGSILLKLQKKI